MKRSKYWRRIRIGGRYSRGGKVKCGSLFGGDEKFDLCQMDGIKVTDFSLP